MKHQTTTQIIDLQSDFLGVEKRRWVLSNDNDIPIIRSKQASGGLYYDLISVEGCYKRAEGITKTRSKMKPEVEVIASNKRKT